MVKRKNPENTPWLVPVLVIAVIAIGGMYLLSMGDESDMDYEWGSQLQVQQPAAVAPATGQTNSGTLSFRLTSATGGTGTTAKVLLLDASKHAVMDNGKLDKTATRYALMKLHQEKGLDGMTAFSSAGSPTELSASSGVWSTTVTGKIGDKVLVYTYEDTTPAATEIYSKVNLVTLIDFYRETGSWVPLNDEGKDSWDLPTYASYLWQDGFGATVVNYTYGDSGSADYDKTLTWYSQANSQGQEVVDGAIYIAAPSNYTSKFKHLKVTDSFGNSVKFDSIAGRKAENYQGAINVAATILTSAPAGYDIYYVGDFVSASPNPLMTKYTSSDANRLTWELKTDTYGSDVTIYIQVAQNSKALIPSNGPFEIAARLPIQFSDGATSGFDTAP